MINDAKTNNATPDNDIKRSRFNIPISLFWRLFLSLLLMILITSMIAIIGERWLNKQELATRMDSQIATLLSKRDVLITALQAGDMAAVKRLYADDRRLMNQIRVYDEQGAIIYPRYRYREGGKGYPNDDRTNDNGSSDNPRTENIDSANNQRVTSEGIDNRESSYEKFNNKMPIFKKDDDINSLSKNKDNQTNKQLSFLDDILQPIPPHKAMADIESRPELAEVTVALPDGKTAIIQLRPHLLFKDVLELQRGNFALRLALILLFSMLVCYWLSRTMSKRILRVQHSVHRMLEGNYQVHPDLSHLGSDEIGMLAKDVAQLSTRLAASEMARKQMLSDISHELRSPLARLDVATELTRDFAPNASRYLDRIDKESTRMNELIEQIIHIQSLQMKQYTTADREGEAVDITEVITEIGQDVCFEFQHKQVQWQWHAPADSFIITGNQEQLYSALENVIRNAFMHTPTDSTVIATIKKVPLAKSTSGIQISISDEGGGVAEQDLERIFQPFVRLDSARHRQTGGYGLGLAIVHAVVMAHQGQLEVYNSEPNIHGVKGLVISISLPF